MKLQGEFPVGLPSRKVNVAVMRPTVNVKEAENLGGEAAAVVRPKMKNPPAFTFSKHGIFNTSRVTHPGLENEE